MSDPFIAEIRAFGFNFAPIGWVFCDGQLLPISQFDAVFALIGTTYGGNGTVNFALPNLMGRAPMDWGSGTGLTPRVIGEPLGTDSVTLTSLQIPSHNHMIVTEAATSTDDQTDTPSVNAWLGSSAGSQMYTDNATTPNVAFAQNAIGVTGGSQPHNNLQPLLVLNFCFSLSGIFPTRS
jgi:microcystin-dependent protein